MDKTKQREIHFLGTCADATAAVHSAAAGAEAGSRAVREFGGGGVDCEAYALEQLRREQLSPGQDAVMRMERMRLNDSGRIYW